MRELLRAWQCRVSQRGDPAPGPPGEEAELEKRGKEGEERVGHRVPVPQREDHGWRRHHRGLRGLRGEGRKTEMA